MKADMEQQRTLLELVGLDAELTRIDHRARHLPEQQRLEAVQGEHQDANDRLAALRIAIDDLNAQIGKLESEIDSVRQREDRDRALLESGSVSAKQLNDLQHELETLQRRQADLEESQLELMERREELTTEQNEALARIDELQTQLREAQQALDAATAELDDTRSERLARREALVAALDAALVERYEKQRARGGPGAGALQGRQCGACRIEIDRGELARINAAPADEVLNCPECGAILLRVKA